MTKIDKILCGGLCMYSNGYLLGRSGTGTVAIFAKKYRKPLYIIIRSFQLTDKMQIDSMSVNSSNYDVRNKK